MILTVAMAFRCDCCGRGKNLAHSVSHSNIKTRKEQLPNLRNVHVIEEGHPRRIRVCSRCLRSGRVSKAA
jgi:large subunit ribosomal protein L28